MAVSYTHLDVYKRQELFKPFVMKELVANGSAHNIKSAKKMEMCIRDRVITVYADRSFSFITKTPPAAVLLKKACGLKTEMCIRDSPSGKD